MTVVFDTEPLVAYLTEEPAATRIARVLHRVASGRERGLASRVTFAELGYVVGRRHREAGRSAVRRLEEEGVGPWPCEGSWEDAADLKARFPALSLADAFAAATARETSGTLLVLQDEPLLQACIAEGIPVRRV